MIPVLYGEWAGILEIKELLIDNLPYRYSLRYSKRAKCVRLQYSSGSGLELIIPYAVKNFNADDFIESKKGWIKKHAGIYSEDKYDSGNILYMGRKMAVEEKGRIKGRLYKIEVSEGQICIYRPELGNINSDELLLQWMKQRAFRYIPKRTEYLAKKYGFIVNRVSLRNQKTRWGSCSGLNNLSFNFRLMTFREEVIDYVIIHELCHTRQMNHSHKFWSLVESIVPDYIELRNELKKNNR